MITLTFLGVGSAGQSSLGHAAAVIEVRSSSEPSPNEHGEDITQRLLIDCGPGTLQAFKAKYQCLPDAIYITHCHLDHVGDFENIFIQSWFRKPLVETIDGQHIQAMPPKVFIHCDIVPLLHQRIASYPSPLAEGGVNFWEAFQLIPVNQSFVFAGQTFSVIPVRHHAPNTAFGLHAPGAFFYTGDTRPIPEILTSVIGQRDLIFHDCGVISNPSHTGIEDVQREYSDELISRMYFYHYASPKEQEVFEEKGLNVVRKDQSFAFSS